MEQQRLHFIDRLRVMAILILVFYHTGLLFASFSNFPVKNSELSYAMEQVTFFFHSWRLALLFFISGIGISISFQSRSRKPFVKERLRHLLIPLLFGILFIVPPQIYFERRMQGFEYDSYLDFYLHSFSSGLYPYGDISWHHLWFVAYLLIYSLLSLPLLALIDKNNADKIHILIRKTGLLVWALPMALVLMLLKPYSSGVQNIFNDLSMFTFYWLVFLAGFVIHNKNLWGYAENKEWRFLTVALLLTACLFYLKEKYQQVNEENSRYYLYYFIKGAQAWSWVLALVFLARKYFHKTSRSLSLFNEAVYPVYILHQTVIICLGYYVVQESWSLGIKLIIILSATYLICWLLYLVIRKSSITRLLFGLTTSRKPNTPKLSKNIL